MGKFFLQVLQKKIIFQNQQFHSKFQPKNVSTIGPNFRQLCNVIEKAWKIITSESFKLLIALVENSGIDRHGCFALVPKRWFSCMTYIVELTRARLCQPRRCTPRKMTLEAMRRMCNVFHHLKSADDVQFQGKIPRVQFLSGRVSSLFLEYIIDEERRSVPMNMRRKWNARWIWNVTVFQIDCLQWSSIFYELEK